ncbi:FCD domain-containing protein [Curtobacterium sp. MCJR17_043]|uniref:FadR/GntR family transcriptional regulator n=1 Tax=Curtobacterium sp. MCJR17_043 TaxID=2175660 RepID=UPI0024DF9E85|nr:FCD domain-containing protein [Curtobacterium sp. MCJR17_043]WIB35445.1 FCD domain-containing protein [Curtobacterium sp. MCJR17_043]
MLGVARVTVRSALARLVDRGLLETRRGRGGGTFVRTQWPASSSESVGRTLLARWAGIQDTADAIALLHGAMAAAAAERITPAEAAALRDRLDAFRQASSGAAKQQADAVLHRSIIDAARNDVLRATLATLEAQISIAAPAHLWGDRGGHGGHGGTCHAGPRGPRRGGVCGAGGGGRRGRTPACRHRRGAARTGDAARGAGPDGGSRTTVRAKTASAGAGTTRA